MIESGYWGGRWSRSPSTLRWKSRSSILARRPSCQTNRCTWLARSRTVSQPVPKARIEAQVADRWGRILARSSTPLSIRRGETVHDLALTLTHAERCSARLQVRITAGDLVLAQASAWLSTERLMPEGRFSRRPLRRLVRRLEPAGGGYAGWAAAARPCSEAFSVARSA